MCQCDSHKILYDSSGSNKARNYQKNIKEQSQSNFNRKLN